MKRLSFLVCLSLVVTVSAVASDGVLVPIFFAGPGSNGSLWFTRLVVFNNSDRPLQGIQFVFFDGCAFPNGCLAPIPPRSSLVATTPDNTNFNNGFFLFPGIEQPDVWYVLRVIDRSRLLVNNGTDVPVVPIDSFSEKPLQLLDVPVDDVSRVTLRVYGISPATPRVRVTVFQDSQPTLSFQPLPSQLLSEHFYNLAIPQSPSPATGSFSRPSGVVINDLFDTATTATALHVRIEVQSTTPGAPIWALASVTNNASQAVTIIAPRPSP
jgi:hypothetical protein